MNIKVDFDNIVVKEDKNDFNVKVLMVKGEKGDQGDGENNIIEEVQVNGSALPVSNKAVNVPIPTNISSFTNDSEYLTKEDLEMVNTIDIQDNTQIQDGVSYGRINKIFGDSSQTGTPSTSSPKKINTVNGDNTLKIANGDNTIVHNYPFNLGVKNLLKISGDTQTINGITFAQNSDGSISVSGTATANATYSSSTLQDITPSTRYTLRGCPSGGSTSTYRILLRLRSDATTNVATVSEIGDGTSGVFTAPVTARYMLGEIIVYSGQTVDLTFYPQLVVGEKANTYNPYGAGYIELCKVGNFQDYLYKENGKWYKYKAVDKIDSYNGETITTSYLSTTGGLDTGATIYYGLTTAISEEITTSSLKEQLDLLRNVSLNEGINNITFTSNDLKPKINLTYANIDVNIYSKEETDDKLDNYYEKNETDNILENYYTKEEVDDISENYYTKEEIDANNSLTNKKFVLIGDSYLEGYTPDGNVTSWGVNFKNYLGLSDDNVIINYLGGSSFAGSKPFSDLVDELDADDKVTDVIVAGGYNDRTFTRANILTGMTTFKNSVKTKFPNANIYLAMIGWSNDPSNLYNLYNTSNNYQIDASQLGIGFMSGTQYSLHDYFSMFSSDGIHPNALGEQCIARNIVNAYLNGNATVFHTYKTIGISASGSCTAISGSTNNFSAEVNNNIVQISSQGKIIFDINDITYNATGTDDIEIANITSGYIIGSNYRITNIPVQLIIHGDGKYRKSDGVLIFRNKKVYISFSNINDEGTNYLSLTSLDEIQLLPFSNAFDSMFC